MRKVMPQIPGRNCLSARKYTRREILADGGKRSEINGMGLKASSRLKSAEEDKSGTLKRMLDSRK